MGPQQSKPIQESDSNEATTEKAVTEEFQIQNVKKKVKLVKRAWNCCGVTDFPYTESCGEYNEPDDKKCKACGHTRCEYCPVFVASELLPFQMIPWFPM